MNYMGSKQKYKKYIVPILQKCIDEHNVDTYIEPFCGGCAIIDSIKCENRYAFDRSDALIALLQTAATDFDKVMKEGSRELWDKGKAYVKDGIMPEDMSLADIGAIEFFQSMSCGGFPRGYAGNTPTRNFYMERYNALKRQAPDLKDIHFGCQNYWELDPATTSGAVILCDPPYQGTKSYGYASQGKMDYNHFWNWVRELSKNNYVFITEQNAPEDFEVLWELEVNRTVNAENKFAATEHLYRWKGSLK